MAGILGAGAVLFIGGFESLEAVGAGDEESLGPAPESRVMVLPAGPVAVRLDATRCVAWEPSDFSKWCKYERYHRVIKSDGDRTCWQYHWIA
jgi:hypothetical protein